LLSTLFQSFRSVAGASYVPALFATLHLNSQVTSIDQVISRLFVDSAISSAHTDLTTDLFIELFLIRLQRYFSLPGHPRHLSLQTPGNPQCISEEAFEKEVNNSLFRIKLFMLAATDHAFVPLTDHWRMTVSFTCAFRLHTS
jgi:hypothetical protein